MLDTATDPRWMWWTGHILTGIVLLFVAMDAAMKLLAHKQVLIASGELGWPATPEMARTLGLILLGAAILYAFPRTAVLGAILLTGFLGGAIATHLRVGSPLLTHTLFGFYIGLAMWGGLWCRSPQLRLLLPMQ